MSAQGRMQQYGEAKSVAPLRRGFCDCCGVALKPSTRIRGGRFCNGICKRKWWSNARTRGGQLYADLMLWRKYRGRKGTPGEGRIGEVATIVDRWLAEDRAAQKFQDQIEKDATE